MPVGGRRRAPRVAPLLLLLLLLLLAMEARLIRAPIGRHRGSAADTGRARGKGDVLRLRLLRMAELEDAAAGLDDVDDGDAGCTDVRARPGGGGLTDRRGGCEWRFFFCFLLGLLLLLLEAAVPPVLQLVLVFLVGEEGGGSGSGSSSPAPPVLGRCECLLFLLF